MTSGITTTRAAQMVAPRQPLRITELTVPRPGPYDAIIRVEASGICRSDWHVWNGDLHWVAPPNPLPVVLGHEVGGVVEEVGSSVRVLKAGDRVTVPFHLADGTCSQCQQGHQNLCDHTDFLGLAHSGAWVRYLHIPNAEVNCLPLPETVNFLSAAALGCRYMTAYHAVVHRGQVQPGQWVMISGCGGVGLSAVQIASTLGAQVIAVDVSEAKLEKARQEGAIYTINAKSTVNVPEAVWEVSGGGVQVSFDCLGRDFSLRNALLSLRKRGRHVQVGLTTQAEQGMANIPLDFLTTREWELVGSLGNPHSRYSELFALVASGRLQPGRLVTRQVSLEDVSAILSGMDNYETIGFNVITQF